MGRARGARLARRDGARGAGRRRARVRRAGDPARGARLRPLLRAVPRDGARAAGARARTAGGGCRRRDALVGRGRRARARARPRRPGRHRGRRRRCRGRDARHDRPDAPARPADARARGSRCRRRSTRRASLTALAAEALGVARRALELAVEYAKERQQFGKRDRRLPGRRASARRLIRATSSSRARSCTPAAWKLDEQPEEAPVAAAAAKAFATETAVASCQRAIQVLGGIGFTWEHPLHRF